MSCHNIWHQPPTHPVHICMQMPEECLMGEWVNTLLLTDRQVGPEWTEYFPKGAPEDSGNSFSFQGALITGSWKRGWEGLVPGSFGSILTIVRLVRPNNVKYIIITAEWQNGRGRGLCPSGFERSSSFLFFQITPPKKGFEYGYTGPCCHTLVRNLNTDVALSAFFSFPQGAAYYSHYYYYHRV